MARCLRHARTADGSGGIIAVRPKTGTRKKLSAIANTGSSTRYIGPHRCLRSLTEAIDTTTAGGMLVFHIFGALAPFERAMIRERTTAGLEAARARGRKGGRRPKLSKSDLRIAKALLRDPEAGVTEVAKQLGVSHATLYRHLPGGRSTAIRN